MQYVLIQREHSTDEGTFGLLMLESGWTCHTLELPWRNNRRRMSCIPAGIYRAVDHVSPRFGRTYWLQQVPDRSEILIHAGNLAGDTSRGYRTDVEGCILVGERRGKLQRQAAVLSSKAALAELHKRLRHVPLHLEIRDAACHR